MKLIIVESPTKAKTISRFLGSGYKIESSFGHIRDLPKNNLGIEIENNFQPKYIIPAKAKKTVSQLKKAAKQATEIILATDEDREGEAIAWHLTQALGLDEEKTGRIVFHEITKEAITAALKTPRAIDLKLVNAQQARRILDRLVGYKLSPFLWKKVAKGLSAGRVQSVAVRLIVEREREIQAFKPQEYWTIEAELSRLDDVVISEEQAQKTFWAKLHKENNKTLDKLAIGNREQAEKIARQLKGAKYQVVEVERKQNKKNPPAPFITSTLQQTANRWLGFSAKQTMVLAQQLYENGFITYMRTDSVVLADRFLRAAQDYLHKNLGEKYALSTPRQFKAKAKNAQEAHEAIRPTQVEQTPESLKNKLNPPQLKLYQLIWQRALASQMPAAVVDAVAADIAAQKTPYQFRATGQTIRFDGYLKIYPEKTKEIELPRLEKGEKLEFHRLDKKQHFTKPPARYSDAGLVKKMEHYGIGRPSTYAPTIATIEARNYVQRDENKRLRPTDIAFVVIDLLLAHFSDIVDYQFTAEMETKLDNIAAGAVEWQKVVADFYGPFQANLEKKYQEIKKADILPEEKSNEVCDKCGAPMVVKTGRFGKFLACSAFPKCKNIKPLNNNKQLKPADEEKIKKLTEKYKNEVCDKCGAPMVIKVGKFGPFLACSAYPKCKNIKNIAENSNSTGVTCPVCGQGEIVAKRSRRGVFYACNRYPECKTAFWGRPTGEKCPQCGSLLLEGKNGQIKCANKECGYIKK